MSKKVRRVNYELVTSLGADLKETLVTYDLEGRTYHYPVFIKPKDGYTNKDYLKEAKKVFSADLKSGQVFRSAKLVDSNKKITFKSKAAKPRGALVVAVCALGATAIALGGFLTYKYLNGGFSSGGPEYKPGQEVEVNPQVNDPTKGNYKVTFSNTTAKVAEKFETTLDLIEKNPEESNPYYLPEKITSVVSNKTVLKEEQYAYTLDAKTKKTATLMVPAENVSGPIVISLALEEGGGYHPGQEVEVVPEVNDPSSGCYEVTFTKLKAVVGGDYSTTIKLTQTKECDYTYILPDKLVSVISSSTVLNPDKKQFTYTLNPTKTEATLDIPGTYVYGKTIVNLALSLVEPEPTPIIIGDPREPLTFVCTSNSGEIDIHHTASGTVEAKADRDLQYRVDNGTWQDVDALKYSDEEYTVMIKKDIKKGQSIQFRGDNSTNGWSYASYDSEFNSDILSFVVKGDFVVGNNVMSLLDRDSADFRSMMDLSNKDGCFAHLFSAEKNGITDANGLWLQATTLDTYVYDAMFSGCEYLKHAPKELPAVDISNCDCCYYEMFKGCKSLLDTPTLSFSNSSNALPPSCCENMFYDCQSLTEAPTIESSTLKLGESCFSGMFENCTSLNISAENASNYLPATELAQLCYSSMFKGCTSLVNAPSLPATTLEDKCYKFMFSGCTSLVDLSSSGSEPSFLPAETLKEECYLYMFEGCISLVNAPSLPATTLAKYCYGNMFIGCTSLTTAPQLPATTLINQCYEAMFEGCTSLVNAPALNSTTLAVQCYQGMFKDCSSLEIAPVLPANTDQLKDDSGNWITGCYEEMFYGCSKLKQLKVGFKDLDSGDFPGWVSGDDEYACTEMWLFNAGTEATEKTFVWAGSTEPTFTRSFDTIPGGWSIVNPTL